MLGEKVFGRDTVKLLMTFISANNRGEIEYEEFKGLWKHIKEWEEVFMFVDHNHSGTIDGEGLRQAFEKLRFTSFDQLIELTLKKYGDSGISFDTFVYVCGFAKAIDDEFKARDPENTGSVELSFDQFVRLLRMFR